MNTNNMDNDKLESLLRLTAQRLGSTPEALKQAARNGTLASMLGNAGAAEGAAMQKVLSDPEAAKKLLSSPEAQKLLRMLQNRK